ncbi:uncharacterized protein F4822DRAFT_443505 [Hypoxylon trugodes]|uniref:uncharacterized protein n=1 Tax=Hypoxylon trugodes TaxID=326681 RepID=UPI00219FB10D|nr:uncharacterized protein F4822DRAFT_443505 [Hypoxylon trugodes]KAI1388625.1 hypothetical protein F4822DRAFT_443505 [Hypoxylon trugodes]
MYEFWAELADRVDQIEQALLYGFSDHQAAGFQYMPSYFLSVYASLVDVLNGISTELAKGNEEDRKLLFNRAVGLLQRFYEYIQENTNDLTPYGGFYYKLWKRIDKLSKQPCVSLHPNILTHIIRMTKLAEGLIAATEQLWTVEGDLYDRKAFRAAYEKFRKLDQNHSKDDVSFRDFALESQQILHEAYLGLRMPLAQNAIRFNPFDDNKLPMYIDASCKSDAYIRGSGERPGVLSLKQKLGGPVPTKEEKGSKKRGLSDDEDETPAPKRSRQVYGYTMTMDNVDADIEDIYSNVGYNQITERPHPCRLITPTFKNRDDTIQNYEAEFLKRLRLYLRNYFKPESPPTTQGARDALLKRLEKEIVLLRFTVGSKSDRHTTSTNLKEARISSYSLKFLRSLYMKLLLSSEPPVSAQRLNQALIDRLDDWILHERAWNAADEKAKDGKRTTAMKQTWIDGFLEGRNKNIESWKALQKQFVRNPLEQREMVEAERPKSEETKNPAAFEAPRPRWAGGPAAPVRDKHQNRSGNDGIYLLPRRADRTIYVNEAAERRRAERATVRDMIRNFGPSGREAERDLLSRYSTEDRTTAQVAAALAKGGPPDYEQIPTGTVFEKLVYMIVLTQWRLYQIRDIL